MHFIILMIGINYLWWIMCILFAGGKRQQHQHLNWEAVEVTRSIILRFALSGKLCNENVNQFSHDLPLKWAGIFRTHIYTFLHSHTQCQLQIEFICWRQILTWQTHFYFILFAFLFHSPPAGNHSGPFLVYFSPFFNFPQHQVFSVCV